MNRSTKSILAGLLASSAILSLPTSLPERRRSRTTAKLNGHSSWATVKDAKCTKRRAKERRAKTARKINWS